MKEASYIAAEDLINLQTDENGNFLIPEGIIIFIDNSEEEKLLKIAELERQLSYIEEPNIDELIQLGKDIHPYYRLLEELNNLKNK